MTKIPRPFDFAQGDITSLRYAQGDKASGFTRDDRK